MFQYNLNNRNIGNRSWVGFNSFNRNSKSHLETLSYQFCIRCYFSMKINVKWFKKQHGKPIKPIPFNRETGYIRAISNLQLFDKSYIRHVVVVTWNSYSLVKLSNSIVCVVFCTRSNRFVNRIHLNRRRGRVLTYENTYTNSKTYIQKIYQQNACCEFYLESVPLNA